MKLPGVGRLFRGRSAWSPAALALVAVLGAGCGADRAEPAPVVATTGFAADITRQLAGPDLPVAQLIPDAAGPHDYLPSAREREQVADARLLVAMSPDLEQTVPIGEARARFFIADHVGPLRRLGPTADESDHGPTGQDESDDDHAGIDPHVWTDPTRVARAVPALARRLARLDPAHADEIRGRAAAYVRRLEALDAEIRRLSAVVPPARRRLLGSHETLGYFADRYGFALLQGPFGQAPDAGASAGRLHRVIDAVRAARVPAVFAAEADDPKVLEQVGRETGAEVVDDLLISASDERHRGYEASLRFTATRISEALR